MIVSLCMCGEREKERDGGRGREREGGRERNIFYLPELIVASEAYCLH
jgi:hypothetical protein